MTSTELNELVVHFYAAFNAGDLDDFVTILHPAVVLQTARGPREGRAEARRWVTPSPAGLLEQRIVLEEVRFDDRGAHAVALIRKQWWWRESDDRDDPSVDAPAHDEAHAALFTFRDGLIVRWQPFDDREKALDLLENLAA